MEGCPESFCDSGPDVFTAPPFNKNASHDNNAVRISHQISNIKKMLHIQKEEVSLDIVEGVGTIQELLLKELDDVFRIKLKQLQEIEEDTRGDGEKAMNLEVFYTSTVMRSLTSLDFLVSRDLVPSTLSYIKACEAKPEHIVLMDSYSSFLYCTGDIVRLYYTCTLGYDPLLSDFLSCIVHDPSGSNVDVCNSDLGNGFYVAKFVASQAGHYTVYIRLYKVPVSGCPLSLKVFHKQEDDIQSDGQLGRSAVTSSAKSVTEKSTDRKLGFQKRPAINKKFFQNACRSALTYNSQFDSASLPSIKTSNIDKSKLCPVVQVKSAQETATKSPTTVSSQSVQSVGRHPCTLEDCCDLLNDPAAVLNSPDLSSLSDSSSPAGCVPIPQNFKQPITSTPLDSSPSFVSVNGPGVPWSSEQSSSYNSRTMCDEAWTHGKNERSHTTLNHTHRCGETATRDEAFSTLSGDIRAKLAMEIKCFQRNDHLRFPIGVSSTKGGNIVVADTGNHRILLYDSRGSALCRATPPRPYELRRPSAVVCFDDGKFAVKDDVCIYMFSKHGEFIRCIGKDRLARPYGLALDREGMLITLALTAPAELWRFDIMGVRESACTYMPLFPKPPPSSKCRFLDARGEYLFVADLGLSTIYKSTLGGHNVCSFGEKGRSPGQFLEPSGVSATEESLFIGDSKNNRVQVFDFNGEYKGTVKFSCAITRPSGIHTSSDGKLYVLNYLHGILKVFHLD